ncbi:conjugation system SOS inhibitor PsiB [Phytobacter diazotrophicus]|uniref:conjugation system SOS inhibitor PsiB n=1 Tax=Phytobacter diazotrophicus TaxID=395631 RepID=UPI001C9A26A9|nr:conjugation system SOS inhibitor PsiB [Phytobacter diazotrophicus]MBY6260083.1 conjugation system SOS inhibitor PsiB [Phytobacter diazotrophicus]
MTTNNINLPEMVAPDFESCRAAGYYFRRELTHTVMAALKLPDNWDMNGEYGSEFGGLFPVQIRLAPAHGIFEMVLCSPGEISDNWLLLLVSQKGQSVISVHEYKTFDAYKLNYAFTAAAVRYRDGYLLSDIATFLKYEVKS